MPAINFQKQFVSKVESGEKRQTIRAMRKRPFKVGDTLQLFYGQRTKYCRRLFNIKCQEIEEIIIDADGFIYINDRIQNTHELNEIAVSDGFKDRYDLAEWFKKTHGLPFHGQLIKW